MDHYADHDGVGLAELVRRGEVTPAELVEAAIARIERHDGALNAIVHRAFDEARAATDARCSAPLPDGPFRGVPFLVKDYAAAVAGWPQTRGSRFAAGLVDDADCGLVARYRQAGLVLLGKTNVPEMAGRATTEGAHLGPCRNPWSLAHSTGGSSGGSAAAVAAGMVPMAHGNDAGGSIRIPAACCGLVGLKPTRDRVPNLPDGADYAYGQQCEHILSRTVRDTAVMLDATGLAEPHSPYAHPARARPYAQELHRAPGRLRIAWSADSGPPVVSEVQAALEATAAMLARLGHEVFPRPLGFDAAAHYAAFLPVSGANFAAHMARLVERVGREPREDEMEPNTWAAWRAGQAVSGEAVMRGLQDLRVLTRRTLAAFEDIDVYLCPVMTAPPPRLGWLNPTGDTAGEAMLRGLMLFPYTQAFNFTGQPSIALPLAQSSDGLPIGLMFTARYADEATLIRLAAQLEKEAPWTGRRPGVWG